MPLKYTNTTLLFLILLFLHFIVSCKNKTSTPEKGSAWELSEEIDTYINTHHANGKFNGSLLIGKGDSLLFYKSYGLANREFSILNFDSTKFLIGSITKPFTALCILLLEKQGKLSVNDTLSAYFPAFPNADKVTIKHLLTHSSGIQDYHALPDWVEDSKKDITPGHTIERVAGLPYRFAPGTGFGYTNSGYILLGLIIEKVSGKSFENYLQTEVLGPLHLTNTGVIDNNKIVPLLAQGYFSTPEECTKASYINYNQPFTSGNMYSTPVDLWKFTRAVMNSTLLPASKTKEIFDTAHGTYGYGWGYRNFGDVKGFGHHGGMNGFVGSITYLPGSEYFICFLTNDDNTPKVTLSEDLVAMLNGEKIDLPEKVQTTPVTDEMIAIVAGDYLVKKGDTLRVFGEGNRLYIQETGQPKHRIYQVGWYTFAFSLFEFNVRFAELKDEKMQHLEFTGKSTVKANRVW